MADYQMHMWDWGSGKGWGEGDAHPSSDLAAAIFKADRGTKVATVASPGRPVRYGGVSLSAQIVGLTKARQALRSLEWRLNHKRRDSMFLALNEIAEVWQDSYDREGSAVGGWASLSEQTQAVRESEGFDPQHPILVRSGSLRMAVTDFPATANSMSRTFSTGDHRGQRTNIRIEHGGTQNQFLVIKARGWKALHQNDVRTRPMHSVGRPGSVMSTFVFRKARPFWFVTPAVQAAGQRGLARGLERIIS